MEGLIFGISMLPSLCLEKVSSYGLLFRFIYIRELKIETFSGRRQL